MTSGCAPPAGATPPRAAEMVTVRFWAAAREAAGTSEASLPATSCADLVSQLSLRGDRLARVLAMSSLLVDGRRGSATDRTPLPVGAIVEVLPPFAGG